MPSLRIACFKTFELDVRLDGLQRNACAIFLHQLHRHAAAEGLGTVVSRFHRPHHLLDGNLPLQKTGTFHFRNKSFLFFNTVSVFCGPATHDTTPTSPRTDITN